MANVSERTARIYFLLKQYNILALNLNYILFLYLMRKVGQAISDITTKFPKKYIRQSISNNKDCEDDN